MNTTASFARSASARESDRIALATLPERIYLYLKHFPAAGLPLRVGTNKAVHGLATGLVANGMEVEVWCEGEQDSYTIAPEGYGIRCFGSKASYRTLRLAPSLAKRLRTLHPHRELVILNGMFHPSVYSLSRKLRRLRIPYVVAPHGPYHPALFAKKPLLKWPYWYLMERRALKGALALQQLDVRHEDFVRRLGLTIPIVATENGFLNRDVIASDQLQWRTTGRVSILYWGRISIHIKGLDVLLKAFDLAAERNDLELTLQGPDWTGETDQLQKLIAPLKHSERIKVLPPVFATSAGNTLVAHDIVCIPSRFEGFGLAALDAMLAARVLMISASAGIAPHIQRCGCGVVMDPTPDAIHKAFEQLLAQRSDWRQMGLRGRGYALEHLHWNGIAARTLAQYQRLLN